MRVFSGKVYVLFRIMGRDGVLAKKNSLVMVIVLLGEDIFG